MDVPTMYMRCTNDSPLHGVHDPHMNGLSLQEMIDTDIKAEFDDVIGDNLMGFHTLDPLDMTELDNLDFDLEMSSHTASPHVNTGHGMMPCSKEKMGHDNQPIHQWSSIVPVSSFSSALGSSPSTCFEEFNLAGNIMVNPNSVMPVQQQQLTTVSAAVTSPRQCASPALSIRASQSIGYGTSVLASPGLMSAASPLSSPVNPVSKHSSDHSNGIYHRKTLKVLPPISSPVQQIQSPSIVNGCYQVSTGAVGNSHRKKATLPVKLRDTGFPKPPYSYSCLIALALKNSHTGSMSVSEIYKFMCDHFPYFKTAPPGWKNSVRHNLSLNKCFEKIEKPSLGVANQRKGCLWAMNPAKIGKMDDEIQKWSKKDPIGIKKGMILPHTLESLERGEMIRDYNSNSSMSVCSIDSEDEDDPRTPTSSVSSQGSQGYDSAGSDFVDIEGLGAFTPIPDGSLNELNLQAIGNGMYDDLSSDPLLLPSDGGSTCIYRVTDDVAYMPNNKDNTSSSTAAAVNKMYFPSQLTISNGNVSGSLMTNTKQHQKFNNIIMQKQPHTHKVFSI